MEVRLDLLELKLSVCSTEIRDKLKWAINGIDIIGCELSQNIKKLLEKKNPN